MSSRDKIYFASDFHLGTPNDKISLQRELILLDWLDQIKTDATELFLVGDIFDFWFEYKHVIPKGFTLFQAKLIELQQLGIKIHLFTGNHDMWMFDYFENLLELDIIREPKTFQLQGKSFLIGHGDGLGPGDYKYKFLKLFFSNKWCHRLFSLIPPFIGMGIASSWSKRSRAAQNHIEDGYKGDDKEWLTIFCNETLQKQHYDYFVFGHRHLPLEINLSNGNSKYINLGDWLHHYTYGVLENGNLSLKTFIKQ